MQLLGFSDYGDQARRLAKTLGATYDKIMIHHFPDHESKVIMPTELEEEIILCRSLDYPNNKLIELLLACSHARQHGVKKITLVSPYLCYMRQDKAFTPGEVVSQKIIGQWLDGMIDKLITVDPHLHRTHNLQEIMPNTETVVLSATPLMVEFLRKRPLPPLLLGPDSESEQWVRKIAETAKLEWTIATKIRHGDHRVQINLPDFDFNNRSVVIVDDVASTGRTIANTAKQLKLAGAEVVSCMITHPLFAADAEQVLTNACISHIWSTDSINHHTNVIQLAELIGAAIKG